MSHHRPPRAIRLARVVDSSISFGCGEQKNPEWETIGLHRPP